MAKDMRQPVESGCPDGFQYMHPLMVKNFGQWRWHDHPRPGVLRHVAASGDEVWVAAGTYKPTGGADQTISFNPPAGVKIYGGFAGTETSRGQRDWITNKTILSGDLQGNDNANNRVKIDFISRRSSDGVGWFSCQQLSSCSEPLSVCLLLNHRSFYHFAQDLYGKQSLSSY